MEARQSQGLGLGHVGPNTHKSSTTQLSTMESVLNPRSHLTALLWTWEGSTLRRGKRLDMSLPCRARITWSGTTTLTEHCKQRGYGGQ